jgi:hypothetical protein
MIQKRQKINECSSGFPTGRSHQVFWSCIQSKEHSESQGKTRMWQIQTHLDLVQILLVCCVLELGTAAVWLDRQNASNGGVLTRPVYWIYFPLSHTPVTKDNEEVKVRPHRTWSAAADCGLCGRTFIQKLSWPFTKTQYTILGFKATPFQKFVLFSTLVNR